MYRLIIAQSRSSKGQYRKESRNTDTPTCPEHGYQTSTADTTDTTEDKEAIAHRFPVPEYEQSTVKGNLKAEWND
jgi:hypothetical protein